MKLTFTITQRKAHSKRTDRMCNTSKTKGTGDRNKESSNTYLIIALCTMTLLEISSCKTYMKFNNHKHFFFLKMGIDLRSSIPGKHSIMKLCSNSIIPFDSGDRMS